MGNQQTLGCSGSNTAASNPAAGPAHSNRFDIFFLYLFVNWLWASQLCFQLSLYFQCLISSRTHVAKAIYLLIVLNSCCSDLRVTNNCNLTFSRNHLSTRSINNNDTNVKQAGSSSALSTVSAAKKKPKSLREKNRFGTVIVKVASLSSNRRVQERQNIFTITPRGALFHGTQCNPALVQKGKRLVDVLQDFYF